MIYEKMHKQLLLVRGLPGSGKSSLADNLGFRWHSYTTDSYFTTPDGKYKFDIKKISTAHKWNQSRVDSAMQEGVSFICVPNTFSQKWEMQPYIDLAKQYAYVVTIVEVQTELTDEELAARNIHGVPVETITKMRKRWER